MDVDAGASKLEAFVQESEIVAHLMREGIDAECTEELSNASGCDGLQVDQVRAQGIPQVVYPVHVAIVGRHETVKVGKFSRLQIVHSLGADEIQGHQDAAALEGVVGVGHQTVDTGQH